MTTKQKLLDRFLTMPKDFEYQELVKLLSYLGYDEENRGRTSGSAVKFVHERCGVIYIHKPHPSNYMKGKVMSSIKDMLKESGLI